MVGRNMIIACTRSDFVVARHWLVAFCYQHSTTLKSHHAQSAALVARPQATKDHHVQDVYFFEHCDIV